MKKQPTLIFVILVVLFQTACWVTAPEGTVQVRTINDKADLIIRPESGGVYSWNVFWDEYYPVSLRAKTAQVPVAATSKDNAALNIKVAVTYQTANRSKCRLTPTLLFWKSANSKPHGISYVYQPYSWLAAAFPAQFWVLLMVTAVFLLIPISPLIGTVVPNKLSVPKPMV